MCAGGTVALLAWSRRPTIPVAATRRTLSGDSSTVAGRKPSIDDQRGACHRARIIAPRTCMRLVQADQDHDAAMRISGEAPRRWAESPIRHPCHVRGRVITTSVRRPPTAATLVGAETIGACLPQAAGRSTTPSSGSPLLTQRQSAINMVLRVAPRASAVRARYQRVSALSGWNRRKRQARGIIPRRTRVLPALASPFSRRRPLSPARR